MAHSPIEVLWEFWDRTDRPPDGILELYDMVFRPRYVDHLLKEIRAKALVIPYICGGECSVYVSKDAIAAAGERTISAIDYCEHLAEYVGDVPDDDGWLERRSVLGPSWFISAGRVARGICDWDELRRFEGELDDRFRAFWRAGGKAKKAVDLAAHVEAFAARYADDPRYRPSYAIEAAIGRRAPNPPDPIRESVARAHDWLVITALRRFDAAVEALGAIEASSDKGATLAAPRPLFLAVAQVNMAFVYIFFQIIRDNFATFVFPDVPEPEMARINLRPALDGDLKRFVIDGVRSIADPSPFDDACFELIDVWEAEGGTDILTAERPFWLAAGG